MYLSEVKDRIEDIRQISYDNEGAHGMADGLYLDVLKAIATGQCKDAPPEDFAEEVLKVENIGFTKWYA